MPDAKRITIGVRAHDDVGANRAAGARSVVDDELVAEAGEKAGEKSGEKKDGGEGVSAKVLEKAIRDLGIDPEKRNPAIS